MPRTRKKTTPVSIPNAPELLQTGPLGYRLIAASRVYTHALADALRAQPATAELTIPQLHVLQVIDACSESGIPGAAIARVLHVTPQTITSVQLTLTERGLITRSRGVGLGRHILNRITPAGSAVVASAQRTVAEVEEQLAASYSHDGREAQAMGDLLHLVHNAFTPAETAQAA